MPSIRSVEVSVPGHRYNNSDIIKAGGSWLAHHPEELAIFERFVGSSQTATRYFSKPLEEILCFNGMSGRAQIFEQVGPELGAQAITAACARAEVDRATIDTFLFTSCTAPVIPSIDGTLIHQLGLDPTVTRLPIYQHGCAGGVVGLALANKFAKAGSTVLLSSIELCSLGFQKANHTAGHLVGSAIFGDGAASAIITDDEDGLVYRDSQSILTADSRHMMGYDILDDGAHLRLDKELPSFLAQHIPTLVPKFLARNGLQTTDIDWWLFHPGGVKILNYLEEAFAIRPEQARWARDVLRNYGNLSSASILFVTSQFLKDNVCKDKDLVLMVGVGPGLTVELILFEFRGSKY